MAMERQLRISGLKDYVAVDFVTENGVIESTPFYIRAGQKKKVLYRDAEDRKWVQSQVKISADFLKLEFSDNDGLT